MAGFVNVVFVPVYLPLPAKSYISRPEPHFFFPFFD
jgi:hypothetical protein